MYICMRRSYLRPLKSLLKSLRKQILPNDTNTVRMIDVNNDGMRPLTNPTMETATMFTTAHTDAHTLHYLSHHV